MVIESDITVTKLSVVYDKKTSSTLFIIKYRLPGYIRPFVFSVTERSLSIPEVVEAIFGEEIDRYEKYFEHIRDGNVREISFKLVKTVPSVKIDIVSDKGLYIKAKIIV